MTIKNDSDVIAVRDFTDEEIEIRDNILDVVCNSYNESIKILEGKPIQSASDILLNVFMQVSAGIFLHIFNNFPSLRESIGAKGMVDSGIEHLKTRIMKELESELH